MIFVQNCEGIVLLSSILQLLLNVYCLSDGDPVSKFGSLRKVLESSLCR